MTPVAFYSEERVRKGAEKLSKFLNAKQQGRLDGFFTVQPKAKEPTAAKGKGAAKGKDAKGGKRKVSPFLSAIPGHTLTDQIVER